MKVHFDIYIQRFLARICEFSETRRFIPFWILFSNLSNSKLQYGMQQRRFCIPRFQNVLLVFCSIGSTECRFDAVVKSSDILASHIAVVQVLFLTPRYQQTRSTSLNIKYGNFLCSKTFGTLGPKRSKLTVKTSKISDLARY